MEVESVSYVFSLAEVEALMDILGCPGIPFCEKRPELLARGRASLEQALVVTGGEAGLAVDKIAAFLVKSVSEAGRYTCVFGGDCYLGLFYTFFGTILLRRNGENWVFTPFRRFGEGRGAFLESVPAEDGQFLGVKNTLGHWTRELSPGDDRQYIFRLAAECIFFDSIPRERNGTQWKQ